MFVRPTTLLCSASLLVVCASVALGGDTAPQPGSTFQCWSFSTPSLPQPPDPTPFFNPNGVPEFSIKGQPQWFPEWPGVTGDTKQGVWCLRPQIPGVPPELQDSLNFIIPNYDDPDPKVITVQYKWWIGTGIQPAGGAVSVILPDGTPFTSLAGSTVPDLPDHPGWLITTHTISLDFCPPFEEIKIFNNPDNPMPLYVDWVCIDTICIPSPGAAGLASLGGLMLLRRRR